MSPSKKIVEAVSQTKNTQKQDKAVVLMVCLQYKNQTMASGAWVLMEQQVRTEQEQVYG